MTATQPSRLAVDDVSGARVLVRADLNVPLNGHVIADDARLRAALPTLRTLASQRNRILVVAHLGRPAGAQPRLSLRPVAQALQTLLDREVPLVPGAASWGHGKRCAVGLLENIRFDPRETSPSAGERWALAAELRACAGADIVVSDAFATFHRRHATIVELVQLGPSAAGRLVEVELEQLALLRSPVAPLVVIAGGTRLGEKLPLLDALATTSATVLLGAQMAASLAGLARGEGPDAAAAQRVLGRKTTVVPSDLLVVDQRGRTRTVRFADLRPDLRTIDLGAKACRRFADAIHAAGTVVWNGPPGLQHEPAGKRGAHALATACAQSPALTIVGGGTTGMPLRRLGLTGRVTHVSTGGTILFHLLLGHPLLGIDALATTSSTAAAAPPQPARAGSARG